MSHDALDFAALYSPMDDTALLDAARSYDSLVDAAQTALRAEFARRHLEPPLIDEPDPSEDVAMVVVNRYRDLSEAIVARSLLESAGIRVDLQDENLVRLDWQVSNFIGGIRLKVAAADAASAIEILSQPIPDPIAFADAADDFVQPHCPRCDSIDITFEGSSRGTRLTALYLVGLPIPTGPKTWLCNACGARWENTEGET